MSKILNKIVFAALMVLLLTSATLPDAMQPKRMVNDFVGLFSAQELSSLENKLRAFNDSTSTQIAVAVVADLEDMTPNEYATQLAEKWGVGTKGKDNGVMILVKPKTGSSKGEVYIAVGYGLEGAIPDITAKKIIEYEMIPAFKENKYFMGVSNASDAIIALSKGEFTADQYADSRGNGGMSVFIIVLIIIVLISLTKSKSSYSVSSREGSRGSLPIMPFLFFGGSSHGRGNDFDSFSGGGGSFGGFGGGSFGGGGAGGSW